MTDTDDDKTKGAEASDGAESANKRKKLSRQEEIELAAKIQLRNVSIEHTQRVLKMFTTTQDGPDFWKKKEYKMIRECLADIQARPGDFPPMMGDTLPDGGVFEGGDTGDDTNTPSLTTNYVSSIARYKDLDYADRPILHVAAPPIMDFEQSNSAKGLNSVHFTHLRLRDGSDDVMTGRLSMHLAHEGIRLDEGDIIQLELFTPCTYPMSGEDKPQRSPMVLIHRYSRLGTAALPAKKLPDPMHCILLTEEQLVERSTKASNLPAGQVDVAADGTLEKVVKGKKYERLVKVECTPENRYCSVYGLSTVQCICITDPVENVDLETVCQYCWFATKEVCKMDKGNKRNVLYWWYMTNLYNVCGKGKRRDPPACLKYAIRNMHKSDDGWYVKFDPGKKK